MAINFPNSPTNGQIFTSGGKSYEYNSTTGVWNRRPEATSPVPADVSDLTDTTNVIPADVSDLTDTTNLLFDGQYSSLTGAPTSSTAGALGTLTKTFTQNEETEITLSENISPVPNVSVFKEVPQGGLTSKGNWDVNANATNYDFFDEKSISYSSANLTPSATGDGTFTLLSDVGYSLSAPSFGSSFNVGSQAGNPQEVVMKTDGTKMYVLDVTTKTIFEYDLSTNFDSSTATYNSVNSGSLGTTVAGDPYGLRFKPDGTKLYICEYGGILYQFSLGTAWDLSTISYDNQSITGFAGGQITYCLAFKPDGTKVYTVGLRYLYEWVLPTAWSLSGATPTNIANGASANYLNIGSATGNTFYGLDFSADGTKFFVRFASSNQYVGTGLYEIPIDSAWDPVNSTQQPIATDGQHTAGVIKYDALDIAHGSNNLTGFAFVNNGQQAVVCYSGAQDYVYTLNTLEALSFSSSDVGKKVVGNSGSAVITSTAGAYTSITPFADTSAISSWQLYGAEGKSDGSGISLTAVGGGYDIANASYDSKSLDVNAYESFARAVDISSDGLHLIVGGSFSDDLHYYTLSTAFDVTTATYVSKIDTHGTVLVGCRFSSTGHKVFTCDANTYKVESFDLSTAYDLSTAGSGTTSTALTTVSSNAQALLFDFNFNNDGTKLFALDRNAYKIHEYTLSTAWDITNLTYVDAYTHTSYSEGFAFNGDGTKLFILNQSGNDKVELHNLSVAFDISTASISSPLVSFDTFEQDDNSYGLCFGNSGQKMYVVGSDGNDTIYQYSTGSILHPYSQYFPALTNSTGQIDSSSWVDLDSMAADETKNDGDVFYAVSTDNRTSWGVIKDGDGVRKIARNNSGTWQYNNDGGSATYYDFSNPTAGAVATSFTTPGWTSLAFNTSGDRVLLTDASYLYSYPLNTSWDISTIIPAPIGTSPIALGYGAGNNAGVSYQVSDDGTKVLGRYNANGITYEYSMSTPFDVTTLSLVGSVNLGISNAGQFYIKPGTYDTYYTISNRVMHKYTFTGGSITNGTLTQDGTLNLDPTNTKSFGYGQILFNPDGTEFYITQTTDSIIEKWTLGTAWDITTATKSSETATFSGIGAVWLKPDGAKIYYIDTNNSNQLSEINVGGFGYGTSETWVDGTNNNEHATLQEALGAQSFNRMDKAQLQAVTDPNHYVLGDTLDLMIAPYAASGTSPLSDGVTIGYQAEALLRQAINGTDYEAEFPALNKVKIKSLAAQNLKIRVI